MPDDIWIMVNFWDAINGIGKWADVVFKSDILDFLKT